MNTLLQAEVLILAATIDALPQYRGRVVSR